MLSKSELERYDRHLVIPEVGLEGQTTLKSAKVLVVGAGGLGAPIIQYLAAAGVGKLGVMDSDMVELSNLQRQVIFSTNDIGKPKATVAAKRASALNPDIVAIAHHERLTIHNVHKAIFDYDIIVDGTDNFPTRYVINDACVSRRKRAVYGAIYRFEGQVTVYVPNAGPCYRCLFGESPDSIQNCAEAGVLGVLPGIIGTIQATETLKLILGKGVPLVGDLLLVDALDMSFRKIKVERNTQCTACGGDPPAQSLQPSGGDSANCTPNSFAKREMHDIYAKGDQAVNRTGQPSEAPAEPVSIDMEPEELALRLKETADVIIIDVREPNEYEHSHIENARHIPLGTLPEKLSDISPDAEVVVYCRSGGRGWKAANILQNAGVKNARNLRGGLTAWSNRIDPTISVYR